MRRTKIASDLSVGDVGRSAQSSELVDFSSFTLEDSLASYITSLTQFAPVIDPTYVSFCLQLLLLA